jgi:translocation and assembly module TamB
MTFNDQSSPAMFLSLSGTCELPDTNVKVILRGPLFSPTLTFQSSPTMATSAILARILFNKDIAEISAIQAFQLAQTLLSLSGDTAPNIIERVRKTLFIDRLNVTTSDNDEILLQISKYLTKGVMFTLSQGVDTQKLTMDVELNQGFLLQAEAGKGQKGKFSLKWNRNY